MAGKIIDLNPRERISKEGWEAMKASFLKINYKDIDSLTVIYTPKDGPIEVKAYGLDFQGIGAAQTILFTLGQDILAREYENNDGEV